MVFYRTYRPQTIEELDTASIRQSLGAVLSSGKIPHAFLFTGPRGLGKTSAARIVAKSINCLDGKNGSICGKCQACRSITDGRSLDVLEIDAASNRGIDEIRDLREKIKLAPTSLKYKVYIIDEVHMLTTEAFNALLKTLEEPPAHAIFILCTTETHKLPETIISRCLRFDFKRANNQDLVRSLERIVEGEKLKVEKAVLEEIAKGADGSFRDAAKILEQVSLSGGKITQEKVKEILGETQNLKPEELLKLLAKKDTKRAVLEINRLIDEGENLRVYTEKILALLHKILMVKVGVEEENGLKDLVGNWRKADIVKLIDLFSSAYGDLKTAVVPQLPLELAAVEWCEGNTSHSVQTDSDGAEVARQQFSRPPILSRKDANVDSKDFVARKGGAQELGGLPAPNISPTDDASGPPAGEPLGVAPSVRSSAVDLSRLWPQIIEATKEYNHTLAGVLRGCKPQNFDGKILTIEARYQFHKDRLNEPKIRELLVQALTKVFNEKVGFKCVLGERSPV